MCKPNEGVPRDTIILYVKSGNTPLAVEVPDGVGVGAGVAIGVDGLEEEFDWLNKGLEGKDFANDIFGESSPPHTMPFEPNTVPTTGTPHPTTDTPGPSNGPPPNIDLNEEWAEPALEDDIANVDGSDDEQSPGNAEFNERTDMTNVRLVKGMEFPNSKVFRKALREYVIQHHIDIK